MIVDYLPHDDESMREHGVVWLGFEPTKLRAWLDNTGLVDTTVTPLTNAQKPPLQLAFARRASRIVH